MIGDRALPSKEATLAEAAEIAYAQAMADFYHPPLPSPIIEYEPESLSFFYIDSNDWKVHLNTAGVPPHLDSNGAETFLRSISHHEIQHYLVCPYDGVTSGMMFAAARKHLNDATAMFVCNLFADLVVDSVLLRRFPRITHERINLSIHESAMRTPDHSPLWLLIVACYRAMWGFPIPSTVNIDQETYEVAEEIVEITRKYMNTEIRWPKASGKIAKLIAEWLPPEEEQLPGMGSPSGGETGETDMESDTILVPLDVDTIMGSPVEDRNGDRARKCLNPDDSQDKESEMERLATEVEQRGGNLGDLEVVYILAGIGDPRSEWVHFWYRAKVRGLVRFEVKQRTTSGFTPLTPETWRLGDPIEELDIVQSLQAFPVLIPNMSTRRWMKTAFYGERASKDLPDMLLVIDSSGSMTYNMSRSSVSGDYHLALLAAFASMDFVLRCGRRVAVINFSDGIRRCSWTRDRREAEKRLLTYQGGGTVAPNYEIEKKCDEAGSKVMVLMITDAAIANWDELVTSVKQLGLHGHKFFMFHIGASKRESKTHRELRTAGATVVPVSSAKDLVGLVVREVRGVYEI